MTEQADPDIAAAFIDAPKTAELRALYAYWDRVRGDGAMPARADINPAEIPRLLPYIIMYNVPTDGGGYNIRLIGEQVAGFIGSNVTGKPAGSIMQPAAAAMMNRILDAVAEERVPKFRAGRTYWHPSKDYVEFEACFLPLSADGKAVNIILGGVKITSLR